MLVTNLKTSKILVARQADDQDLKSENISILNQATIMYCCINN